MTPVRPPVSPAPVRPKLIAAIQDPWDAVAGFAQPGSNVLTVVYRNGWMAEYYPNGFGANKQKWVWIPAPELPAVPSQEMPSTTAAE